MKSPLAVIFLTVALDLIGFGMVVPLLPLYGARFGASATQIAWLFASYSLMQFVCAPLWGRLSDRVGRRPVLLFTIFVNALALTAYGLAGTFQWLLAARIVAGACNSNISVANAYVADVTPLEGRARGMGLIGAAFGIGFVIGPFAGGELSRLSLGAPAFVAAGLSLVNFVWAFFFLPESLPPGGPVASRGGWQERLRLLRQGRLPKALLTVIFLQVFGFSMMEMALVLFARARVGFEAPQSGRLFAFMGVVLALVQGGLIGPLSRRFGEVTLVRAGLVLVMAGLLCIPLTPLNQWSFLATALALLAMGQGLASPGVNSLLSRWAPEGAQGATLGVGQSLSSLARVLGPAMAGVTMDLGSENWPFWVGAAVIALALAVSVGKLQSLRPVSP